MAITRCSSIFFFVPFPFVTRQLLVSFATHYEAKEEERVTLIVYGVCGFALMW